MAGYTKEFLIDAVVSRYAGVHESEEKASLYKRMLEVQYDMEGKDKFRVSASLDAAAIREYKARPKMAWSEAIQKLT